MTNITISHFFMPYFCNKLLKMSKSIYITTIEPNSGKSLISLGILRMMLNQSSKVGYFRPIINKGENNEFDNHTNTAINYLIDGNKEKVHHIYPGIPLHKSNRHEQPIDER